MITKRLLDELKRRAAEANSLYDAARKEYKRQQRCSAPTSDATAKPA
jgi:hypothetical protein